MTTRISLWLAPRAQDPDLAQREYLLNWVLVGLAGTGFLYGLVTLVAWATEGTPLIGAVSGFAIIPFYALAFWLGRRGHLRLAASIPTALLLVIMLVAQYQLGLGHSTLIGLAMATVTAGALLGFWPAVLVALLGTIGYAALGLAQEAGSLPQPLLPQESVLADSVALGFGLLALVLLVWFSNREVTRALGRARASQHQAQAYAQELESIQERLERQVEARTQELTEFALQLQTSLAEQGRLWDTVQRLSIPMVPVHEGVLVTPLIGHIDPPRAERLVDDLLAAIEEQDARVVIMDVTGVPVMDSQVANSLIKATNAARLLGAEMVLVGVRPDVADTVARLGLSLGDVTTRRDLQAGVRYALTRTTRRSA